MSIDSARRAIDAAPSAPLSLTWTRVTRDDGYVFVKESPVDLARAGGLDVEDLALAACVQSEVGSLPSQYKYAVAEAIHNDALARGETLLTRLTSGTKAPGHFGQQSGRFAATSQKPTGKSLAAARLARAGAARGFTRGARRFIDPKVHDGGIQAGKSIPTAEAVIRSRYNEGWKWVGPLHDPVTGEWLIESYVLFLFSKSGTASLDEALAELDAGRKRNKTGTSAPPIPVAAAPGLILILGAGFALAKELL